MPQRRVTKRNPKTQLNHDPVTTNATKIEILITQRVTEALANLETNRNVTSKQGGGTGRDSTEGGNTGQPRACDENGVSI